MQLDAAGDHESQLTVAGLRASITAKSLCDEPVPSPIRYLLDADRIDSGFIGGGRCRIRAEPCSMAEAKKPCC